MQQRVLTPICWPMILFIHTVSTLPPLSLSLISRSYSVTRNVTLNDPKCSKNHPMKRTIKEKCLLQIIHFVKLKFDSTDCKIQSLLRKLCDYVFTKWRTSAQSGHTAPMLSLAFYIHMYIGLDQFLISSFF
jgi:hypothetical protein